MPKGVK
jgi:hypothetical protein